MPLGRRHPSPPGRATYLHHCHLRHARLRRALAQALRHPRGPPEQAAPLERRGEVEERVARAPTHCHVAAPTAEAPRTQPVCTGLQGVRAPLLRRQVQSVPAAPREKHQAHERRPPMELGAHALVPAGEAPAPPAAQPSDGRPQPDLTAEERRVLIELSLARAPRPAREQQRCAVAQLGVIDTGHGANSKCCGSYGAVYAAERAEGHSRIPWREEGSYASSDRRPLAVKSVEEGRGPDRRCIDRTYSHTVAPNSYKNCFG